jgi:hypothetical protein
VLSGIAEDTDRYTGLYVRLLGLLEALAKGWQVVDRFAAGSFGPRMMWPAAGGTPDGAGNTVPAYTLMLDELRSVFDGTRPTVMVCTNSASRVPSQSMLEVFWLACRPRCGLAPNQLGNNHWPGVAGQHDERMHMYFYGARNRPVLPNAAAQVPQLGPRDVVDAMIWLAEATGDSAGVEDAFDFAVSRVGFLGPEITNLATPPVVRFRGRNRAVATLRLYHAAVRAPAGGLDAAGAAAVNAMFQQRDAAAGAVVAAGAVAALGAAAGQEEQDARALLAVHESFDDFSRTMPTFALMHLSRVAIGWNPYAAWGNAAAQPAGAGPLADGDHLCSVALNSDYQLSADGLYGRFDSPTAAGIDTLIASMTAKQPLRQLASGSMKRLLGGGDGTRFLVNLYHAAVCCRGAADVVGRTMGHTRQSYNSQSGMLDSGDPDFDNLWEYAVDRPATTPPRQNELLRLHAECMANMLGGTASHWLRGVNSAVGIMPPNCDRNESILAVAFSPMMSEVLFGEAGSTHGGRYSPNALRLRQQIAAGRGGLLGVQVSGGLSFNDIVGLADVAALYTGCNIRWARHMEAVDADTKRTHTVDIPVPNDDIGPARYSDDLPCSIASGVSRASFYSDGRRATWVVARDVNDPHGRHFAPRQWYCVTPTGWTVGRKDLYRAGLNMTLMGSLSAHAIAGNIGNAGPTARANLAVAAPAVGYNSRLDGLLAAVPPAIWRCTLEVETVVRYKRPQLTGDCAAKRYVSLNIETGGCPPPCYDRVMGVGLFARNRDPDSDAADETPVTPAEPTDGEPSTAHPDAGVSM